MGLTRRSTGKTLTEGGFSLERRKPSDKIIAIAGNPNVGKSTLFNGLTGLKQHTGNWAGKTVSNSAGHLQTKKYSYILVDIPGTYSLYAHSAEEEVARNFICFGKTDGVIIVCDAGCLERNLNLVIQIAEITDNIMVCVNLMDEAEKKGIFPNLKKLSELLGVPVVGTVARNKKSLGEFIKTLDSCQEGSSKAYKCPYPLELERAVDRLSLSLSPVVGRALNTRWLALRLLENDLPLIKEAEAFLGVSLREQTEITEELNNTFNYLDSKGIKKESIKDIIAFCTFASAEELAKQTITRKNEGYPALDRKIDKVLTSRKFGYPIMLLLLCLVFWLTIKGANYASEYLYSIFNTIEFYLSKLLLSFNCPSALHKLITEGIFRVPAWVISVMLPPMAIFFPFFTLLEDLGYLPRIAYNLDKPFKSCNGCGKQALTMCMGFGCNASGVVGCRIIDSKRERLLGIVTNSLVPCNGRFPTIITVITMFFVAFNGFLGNLTSTLMLTATVLLGVIATFFSTKLLSLTLLKGQPSSYTLELPPYRTPQPIKIISRSIFDRTLFVLGRSVSVALPAGAIIWLMANISLGDQSILHLISNFLDPFGRFIGLDGVILIAFILGFPANEIVLPIAIMTYLAKGSIAQLGTVEEIRQILVFNGWTTLTALNVIIFTLFHWPCSTTLLTIKKESGSIKWTLLSLILPTLLGILLCLATTLAAKLFSLII